MTIHLVGSGGFIGKAIKQEALSAKINIVCWSHSITDDEYYFDLLDPESWDRLLSSNPKNVILLSWPGLPNYSQSFHLNRNLPACMSLVDSLVKNGLTKLVVSGTCYEYGLQNGAMNEDCLTDPINSYSIAKDCLRRYIFSNTSYGNLLCCWARIFYAYGDGQNKDSLFPSLTRAILSGQQEFPISSGRQLRDFVPVQKVAKDLISLALSNAATGVFNIGTGVPRSVLEMAELLIEEMDSGILLKKGFYPDRSDEPLAFWADMAKFKSL